MASEKLPVAVNCCCVPTLIDALAGVTLIETSEALVTVSVVVPETPLMLAVIVELPVAIALASPATPLVLIVATEVCDEVHVTLDVRFCVVPSLNLP